MWAKPALLKERDMDRKEHQGRKFQVLQLVVLKVLLQPLIKFWKANFRFVKQFARLTQNIIRFNCGMMFTHSGATASKQIWNACQTTLFVCFSSVRCSSSSLTLTLRRPNTNGGSSAPRCWQSTPIRWELRYVLKYTCYSSDFKSWVPEKVGISGKKTN